MSGTTVLGTNRLVLPLAIATVLPAILVGAGGANFLAIGGVAFVLVAAGLVASALPARRAMHLDPTTALQAE